MTHTAIIICGNCNHHFPIGLGLCSSLLCPSCKTEIQMGESEYIQPEWEEFPKLMAMKVATLKQVSPAICPCCSETNCPGAIGDQCRM